MILYGTSFSPFVLRVLLVARAKGHDLELVPPPGEGRAAEFRAINPLGKVPCLVDGDLVLPESEVIANYLDEMLPGPRLWPDDPRSRAREARIVKIADHYVVGGLHRLILAQMMDQGNPEAMVQHQSGVRAGLQAITYFRDRAVPWLTGKSFGHGDALLLPIFGMASYFDSFTGFGTLLAEHREIAAYWEEARKDDMILNCLTEQATGFRLFVERRGIKI